MKNIGFLRMDKNRTETVPLNTWQEDLIHQAERCAIVGRDFCTCPGSYHALWGALRAANLDEKQEAEVPVLNSILLSLLDSSTRVLIGGSADPGLLCKIGRLSNGGWPDVTIVERCRAPLKVIEEFTTSRNIPVSLSHTDLLELDGRQQWDLILLHYTITFVATNERRLFFARLADALAPDGTLLCMVRTCRSPHKSHPKELKTAYFRESLSAIRAHGLDKHWNEMELQTLVGIYAAERSKRKLEQPSVEDLSRLLSDVGLSIVSDTGTGLRRSLEINGGQPADLESSAIILARHATKVSN